MADNFTRRPGFSQGTPSRFDADRQEMVDLLRNRGITDEQLLRAMSLVDRRQFVQSAFAHRAYEDSALPIGMSQTISQPYTVAFMTEALAVKRGARILEIGTGSGYQAAVLAEMGARVFTIERHMDLLTQARKRFDRLGYLVVSHCGDGTLGWKEYSPFDGIIVTAGAPNVPQPLFEQLNDKGRLVIPIGDTDTQTLSIILRDGNEFYEKKAGGFKFVPLIGKIGWK
jgi:protein-L-isoaspartate(D-aspartate) O-methyltransferase